MTFNQAHESINFQKAKLCPIYKLLTLM